MHHNCVFPWKSFEDWPFQDTIANLQSLTIACDHSWMHLLQVERQQAIKLQIPLGHEPPPFREMLVMVSLLLRLMLGASDWVPSLLPQFNEGEDRWQAKCEKGG